MCLPFIWTHPSVEHTHRSITQTSNNEGTLGVTGQAGHTTVCARWDVLRTQTGQKAVSGVRNYKVLECNTISNKYIVSLSLLRLQNNTSNHCVCLTAAGVITPVHPSLVWFELHLNQKHILTSLWCSSTLHENVSGPLAVFVPLHTWTFISLSVSQILTTRTSPDVMRRPVSCSQSTTMPAPTTQWQDKNAQISNSVTNSTALIIINTLLSSGHERTFSNSVFFNRKTFLILLRRRKQCC